MSDEVVIDTNVLLVADGAHPDASSACILACVKRLNEAKRTGVIVVVDDRHRILREYARNLTDKRGKGAGLAFWKWLEQNQTNQAHVCQVHLTETSPEHFREFPDKHLEPEFDASDRKFAAVANAHPAKPPIWQATDSKWIAWWQALAAKKIHVVFLCPQDVRAWYARKFPDTPVPELPP